MRYYKNDSWIARISTDIYVELFTPKRSGLEARSELEMQPPGALQNLYEDMKNKPVEGNLASLWNDLGPGRLINGQFFVGSAGSV